MRSAVPSCILSAVSVYEPVSIRLRVFAFGVFTAAVGKVHAAKTRAKQKRLTISCIPFALLASSSGPRLPCLAFPRLSFLSTSHSPLTQRHPLVHPVAYPPLHPRSFFPDTSSALVSFLLPFNSLLLPSASAIKTKTRGRLRRLLNRGIRAAMHHPVNTRREIKKRHSQDSDAESHFHA